MVIGNFYLIGVGFSPLKAQTPLIVNADTMLPRALAYKLFQMIRRRYSKVIQIRCIV